MAGLFRHSAMKLLRDQQLRASTPERRLEQLNRIEALLEELDAGRRYSSICVFASPGSGPNLRKPSRV